MDIDTQISTYAAQIDAEQPPLTTDEILELHAHPELVRARPWREPDASYLRRHPLRFAAAVAAPPASLMNRT